jgi:GNAT superfamily N-acetyltransferase
VLRAARDDELSSLQDIERTAGAFFRELGMHLVADDEPPTTDELLRFQQDGRAWVCVDENDDPIAYVLVDVVDGWLNLEQVSVHPAYPRRGLGRQLIDLADRLAAESGLGGLTLTAYVDVPWNGPYYERLGFRVVPDDETSHGMRAIREEEARRGLDAWPRAGHGAQTRRLRPQQRGLAAASSALAAGCAPRPQLVDVSRGGRPTTNAVGVGHQVHRRRTSDSGTWSSWSPRRSNRAAPPGGCCHWRSRRRSTPDRSRR